MTVLKNKPWWFTLTLGALALAMGLVLLLQPAKAQALAGLLAAVYLGIAGLLYTLVALPSHGDRTNFSLVRGLAGLGFGAGIFLLALLGAITPATGYVLLAIGLIIFGGLGLFVQFYPPGTKPFKWGPVIVDAVLLIWGVLILFTGPASTVRATVSGWVLLLVGVVGLAWGLLTFNTAAAETP